MGNEIEVSSKAGSTVATKNSQDFLDEMDEKVRAIASGTAELLRSSSLYSILTTYKLGEALLQLRSLQHIGEAALEKQVSLISAYWTSLGFPCRLGDAYALCAVVTNFPMEFIRAQHGEPMASGAQLTWSHFVQLTKVEESHRLPWLKRIREESLSANQFQLELVSADLVRNKRFGGRKPAIPTSAPTIMNVTRAKFASARRFLEEAGTCFTEICLDHPADQVDENYVRQTEQALAELEGLLTKLNHVRPELRRAYDRAVSIVEQRGAATEVKEAEVLKVETRRGKARPKAAKAKGGGKKAKVKAE